MTELSCRCGRVTVAVEEPAILASECCCTSCRTAGAYFETLPDAPRIVGETGGTQFALYRKDRVRISGGSEFLREHRLKPDASTRRIVATCCNTPVFLDFTHGHWLSLYALLWPEAERPAAELRTMTGDLPDRSVLPKDIPNPKTHTAGFMFRLLGAWLAMGFRTPRAPVMKGLTDAG